MLLIVMFDTKIRRQYVFYCFHLDLTDAVVARLLAYIYESEQQYTMKTSSVITFLALSFLSLFVNASDRSRRLGMMSKKKNKASKYEEEPMPSLQTISVANTDALVEGYAYAGGDATAEASAALDVVTSAATATSYVEAIDGYADSYSTSIAAATNTGSFDFAGLFAGMFAGP
jgi:hypothetical protein